MNNQRTVENSFIDYLIDSIQSNTTDNTNINPTTIVDIIMSYNRVIDTYNRNICDLVSLLRTRNINQSHRTRTTTIPTTSSTMPTAEPPDTARTPPQETPDEFYRRHAPDRGLTQSEIQNVVSSIIYDNEQVVTTCPISLEEFTIGESICKINACGHIFKRSSLITWFNNHSRCPICRHNLATQSTDTTPYAYTSSPQNRISNSFNSMAYRLLSSLNTNPEDIETSYTFTIPIYYDISGNGV